MPPSTSTSASTSQVSRSTRSAPVGPASESTESGRARRDDIDAVRLDAAVRFTRAGHGDGLAFLKIGRLADHGLAHDDARIERDLDVGVAARVMDGQAVAGQVGDGAGGA